MARIRPISDIGQIWPCIGQEFGPMPTARYPQDLCHFGRRDDLQTGTLMEQRGVLNAQDLP